VNGAITATHLDSDLSGWAMAGGLVGYATSCATTNGKVNATVSGKSFTGGAIGYASELDIANVQVVATVTGTGDNAGGLLGYASTINISDSSASGSVTGGAGVFGSIGGFAGYANNVTVTRAFAAEVVTGVTRTGGFFGAANGASVTDAYVTGTVTNPDEYIGNFAGSAGGLNLTRVYIANRGTGADIDIVGINSSAPSMVDVLQSSGIDQSVGRFTEIPMKTSAQMKRAQTFREIGWDFETVWMMNPPSNGGMPMLRSISGINACVVKSFSPVLFAKGSVKLNAAARERIRRIAAAIAFGPCSKLKITGYTSTVEGKGKRKTKLSKLKSIAAKRAAVVQTYLTAQLVALGDSFTTVLSNGNRQNPVASNKTSRGQAKNRRVVISILR
jgi:outer membrane protein OmpA-like peptidoglycan-associated protein